LLTEEQITMVKTGTFRTRASRQPLRLLAPPAVVVSPETAVIHFRMNQIALATIAYGEVGSNSPDILDALSLSPGVGHPRWRQPVHGPARQPAVESGSAVHDLSRR
jgi:hypothetical protein